MKSVKRVEVEIHSCDRCKKNIKEREVYKEQWVAGETYEFCEECYNALPKWAQTYLSNICASELEGDINISKAEFDKGAWLIYASDELDGQFVEPFESIKDAQEKALEYGDDDFNRFETIVFEGKIVNSKPTTSFGPEDLGEIVKKAEHALYEEGSVPEDELQASHYRMKLYAIATLKELATKSEPRFCDPGYLGEKISKLESEMKIFSKLRGM